jgi:hypothetical protein
MTKVLDPKSAEAGLVPPAATQPVLNPNGPSTCVVLNWEDFGGLAENSSGVRTIVIYESVPESPPTSCLWKGKAGVVFSVPITEWLKNAGPSAKNIVVIGLLAGWFGIERGCSRDCRNLQRRRAAVVETCGLSGGTRILEAHPLKDDRKLTSRTRRAKLLTDGNDMCAAAAIFAGYFSVATHYAVDGDHAISRPGDLEIRRYGHASGG